MGYQLWTSPVTGYRRTGTRLSELRELLSSRITARAILEPLQSCPAAATATEMQQILGLKEFDVAGVQRMRGGPVIGLVEKKNLTSGIVGEHIQPIPMEQLISDSTPLFVVLSILKNHPFSFVLVGAHVRGIVARTDANKPPVRVYLFGLISLLEMHLRYWIRDTYHDESWTHLLKVQRTEKAREQQADRKKVGEEVQLVDCLQFCDKRDIFVKSDKIREILSIADGKRRLDRRLKKVEALRNLLAHSQSDIVEGSSWTELIELIEWMENLVTRSDILVEKQARATAGLTASADLWP